MNKQEKQEYRMYVENKYDLLVKIQENRNISYGELYYVENLKLRELKEFEKELDVELDRIAKIVKEELYYLIEE